MDEVAEVKARLDITEVVGGYLPLKQAGRNLKAPCPFHEEKSASFMVSPEKGIYHCFGCSEGGDIFNFVMKMEGLDFRGALELLARKAGVELTARKGDNKDAQKLRERLFAAHELTVKYFQASLVRNPKALEYVIKKRRLNKETIQNFQIGYAPDSWGALTEFLQKKGFTQQELLQGGLAGQKQGKTTIYDIFRGRVMFTICDREGRPIGFTGRVLDDSVPKYLNTPQTAMYDKSSAIFGLHLAKEAIRSADRVVLVEGNMDVIASHQAGVKNVVAASGTALTSAQLKTLRGITRNVVLAFDSDRAGMAATQRVVPIAQKFGINLFALQLNEAKDADELIQKDPQLWVKAIDEATEIRDYWLARGLIDFDVNSTLGKRQFTERMIEIAKLYASTDQDDKNKELTLDQDAFLSNVAEKSGVDIVALRTAITKQDKIQASKSHKTSVEKTPAVDSTTEDPSSYSRRAVVQAKGRSPVRIQHEELLLGLNTLKPDVRACLNDLQAEDFSSPERRALYTYLAEHPDAAPEAVMAAQEADNTYAHRVLLIAEEEYLNMELIVLQQLAFELARVVLLESNIEKKQSITVRLREAEQAGDDKLKMELLKKYQAIIEAES